MSLSDTAARTILLVEDDLGIAALIKDTILETDQKLNVIHFPDGIKTVEWLRTGSPDLMLLDYSLPDMNAAELLALLAKNNIPVPPFIVTTGVGDERIAVEMMKKGAKDYLIKDFLFLENLQNVMSRVLREADTERQLAIARQQLQSEREQLISILDGMNEPIYISDPQTHELLYVNSAMKKIFGATTGEKCHKALHGMESPCPHCNNEKLFSNNDGKTIVSEHKNERLGRWFRYIDRTIRWADGRYVKFEMAVDITDSKNAEEEKNKMDIQLQKTQKLESLGVLAGGIAHDFNNLLTTIMGNIELTISELPPDSPLKENLSAAVGASKLAADLCKQMLAYSGKAQFLIEALSLNDVAKDISQILDASISKKALLLYSLDENIPYIQADAPQIRQVILNLVINASESLLDKSGIINIKTSLMHCDRDYISSCLYAENVHEDDYVVMEVTDNGCGMTETTLARIFDPFFTTKFTGRGLGLAAVLGIARSHKGFIKVESQKDKGTCFKIHFPKASQDAQLRKPENAAPVSEWKGHGTILLVDDVVSNLTMGRKILSKMGFEILTATDGLEALDVYKLNTEKIVCVILDMTMPNMDGEETFLELHKLNPNIKVIICSGYNEQDVTGRFAGKNISGFLQKPYKMAGLSEVLKNVLDPAAP